MDICKTDITKIVKYLNDASSFYKRHAEKPHEENRAYHLKKLAKKIEKNAILQETDSKQE